MSKEQMTAAAELLRKGGTLVTEACNACGGVQVKYSGKIVCINCGKQEETKIEAKEGKVEAKLQTGVITTELKNIVLTKINEILPALKSESDIGKQSELAKLLICYLEVLRKIPEDNESRQ